MRNACFFLLWAGLLTLWPSALPAQGPPGPAAVHIDQLKDGYFLLNKGWRYHRGDNPAWAQPDFDDRAWDTITVARPGRPLPPYARQGAGWFRLRLRLADSLRAQVLHLTISRSLAGFEVYLNGRLLERNDGAGRAVCPLAAARALAKHLRRQCSAGLRATFAEPAAGATDGRL